MMRRVVRSGLVMVAGIVAITVIGGTDRDSGGEGAEVMASDPRLQRTEGVLMLDGELFTGRVVERYEGGEMRSSAEYREGLPDGISESWYTDGTQMERRVFDEGMKEGMHEGWWEDGSPRFVYEFSDDLHEGRAREWFENGQIFREFNYVEGREEGMQIMYFEDGSTRANYRVVDGRRYGSIGAKPCRSDEGVTVPSIEAHAEVSTSIIWFRGT